MTDKRSMHDIMKELEERIKRLEDTQIGTPQWQVEMSENMSRVLELHKQVLENWQFMFEVFKASQGIDELVNGETNGQTH